MAPSVLEMPPPPAAETPVDDHEPIVRAYRLDWTFDNVEDEDLPAGMTRGDLDQLEDTVYYSEKYADQVWPHVDRWLREVPYSDVTVQRVEVPLSEWTGTCLGDAEEVSEP